jgi:spore maturation protein CgeB
VLRLSSGILRPPVAAGKPLPPIPSSRRPTASRRRIDPPSASRPMHVRRDEFGFEAPGVIVGNPEPTHVGAHLFNAARWLGIPTVLADVRLAHTRSLWSRVTWRLGGRRPRRIQQFGRSVVDLCARHGARWLLATGIAPLDVPSLDHLRKNGIRLLNFLTDDPWNQAHRADWFLHALPKYDYVFSPRRANFGDLSAIGCRAVSYCAFAYAPEAHYRSPSDVLETAPDVVFVGGADADRLPYVHALAAADLDIALYGGYWERDPIARRFHRGFADAATVRSVTSRARLSLCLVRRANRDGHVMRSFEIPAMGGCMVAEDTDDHRLIFGPDGDAVLYFSSVPELIQRVLEVRHNTQKRAVLLENAHRAVVDGQHTYADRLTQMIEAAGVRVASQEAG